VTSWIATQLVAIEAEVARRLGDVGRQQQQPRLTLGFEQRDVVLTEHALGEHSRERADLGPQK
jgi:hypothetical protein